MRIFVVVAIVSSVAPARADDVLSLPQVLAAAVRQAPDLERASIDVKVAEAALLRAKGVEDAHLATSGQYQTSSLKQTAEDGSHFSAVATTVTGTLSLTKPLSTGTVIGIEAETVYSSQGIVNNNFTNVPGIYFTSPSVVLTQPLLRGGWSGFDAPIRDAEHQRDAATLAKEARARTLIVQIAEAYWQVALARESLVVRQKSLDLANKQLDFTQKQIRTDKMAPSEELAVKQVIATRQQDLIVGEQLIFDRSLALRELAGLEIGPADLDVKTDALGNIGDDKLDIPSTVAAALEHSAELAGLGAAVKAAQANLDGATANGRPRLDVEVNAGPAGGDPSFKTSVTNAIRGTGYQVTGNLTFDAAIERRAEKGGLTDAHARLQRARVDERAARARIASQAIRIVQRIKAAYASAKLSDEAIALAEQNIDNEQKRFLLGRSTNFDVSRRQDELEQARLRRVSAIVDYLGARVELDALTGAIFKRFGITLR